jgi:HD-GYP domain-containing protein (c-di-GMP phosphodiesterase class II)
MNPPVTSVWTPKSQMFDLTSKHKVVLVEELLKIGTALSSSRDLDELLNLILSKSREITCSDAGSVYLIEKTDEVSKLVFKIAQNDSLPNVSFQEITIPLTQQSLAGYVALTGESLNLADAYEISTALPYQLDRSFDEDFAYRTRSVLVLPMQDQNGETIGVLQLINRKIRRDAVVNAENAKDVTQPYSDWEEKILRSLASQAAISIERNMLQESIENLFECFVRASVQAIEARDPTTSGHSERVADLTVRLSQEVNSIDLGALRLFYFDERQMQEIRYAALLHDFGKIGVPEAILNKEKKLYGENLELIRQRFAIAQRTAEMECAQQKFRYLIEHPRHWHQKQNSSCPHCQHLANSDRQLEKTIAQLNYHLKLIETLNEPFAIASKDFQASLEELEAELLKLSQYTYRDIDGRDKPLLTQTEIEQLKLPRGNLTIYERTEMESHVSQTYEFLKQISWTKHLEQVPLIAYGHHEKLDGTGYPRGLKQEEIPIQSQMMTIADIYDALTASDRPYKKSLSIELALRILREEAEKSKINYDLVRLFEERQVFKVLGHDCRPL